ncbi:MAG: hypothetical protein ACRDZX_05920, partial [Acidimicrobiales bacterium]
AGPCVGIGCHLSATDLTHVERPVVGQWDPREQPSHRCDRSGRLGPYRSRRRRARRRARAHRGGPRRPRYILNGPEALTARQEVEILSGVLGRTIELVIVTPEQAAKEAIARGTPAHLAMAMRDLNRFFRRRLVGQIGDDVENLTGVAPATFGDWCERHADEFRLTKTRR